MTRQTAKFRLLSILCLFLSTAAVADVFRPAYLEITELGDARYAFLWKVPATATGMRLSAYVVIPDDSEQVGERRVIETGNARIERWVVHRAGGLAGEEVRIEGNAIGVTDVIARLVREDGSSLVQRLSMPDPVFEVPATTDRFSVAWSYTVLGIEHILGGIDHLLFVLALLFIVRKVRSLIWTITAFTVAHSLTLAAATLGWVQVPGPPVEATIALSIVFVAGEILHGLNGRPGITARAPWLVAFSFGLLHGLGFAGALAEVGLPANAIPTALLTFNIGVELGQLIFIALILLVGKLANSVGALRGEKPLRMAAYSIGSIAAFWTIERVLVF